MARSLVKPFVKKVLVHDRGWRNIKNQLSYLGNSYVKVGLPEDGEVESGNKLGSHEEALTMSELVTVGVSNEFGTYRIPERSFMRSTFDEQKKNIDHLKEQLYNRILDGKTTVQEALDKLGVWFTAKVKRKITAIRVPANAPATIARKGSSSPLIDTGQMRASIQHKTFMRRVPLDMVEI